MLLFVQIKDYWDGTWEHWPEQVPVFACTAVAYLLDVALWVGLLDENTRTCAWSGVGPMNLFFRFKAEKVKSDAEWMGDVNWFAVRNAVWLVVLLLHLIVGVVWCVTWAQPQDQRDKYGPHGNGENDWGADIAMSKTFGNWLTVVFQALVFAPRLVRS
jgi:hypothetical protein